MVEFVKVSGLSVIDVVVVVVLCFEASSVPCPLFDSFDIGNIFSHFVYTRV